jgi:hypothetical protein
VASRIVFGETRSGSKVMPAPMREICAAVLRTVRAAWQAHQRHPVRERTDDGAGAGMAHDRAAPRQQQRLRHVLFDRHVGRQRFECLRLGPEAAGQDERTRSRPSCARAEKFG